MIGRLDETMAVADGDVVLVPRGHHPCGAPYGFEMYYLNVMAGPLRKWRFVPAPEVEWIMETGCLNLPPVIHSNLFGPRHFARNLSRHARVGNVCLAARGGNSTALIGTWSG